MKRGFILLLITYLCFCINGCSGFVKEVETPERTSHGSVIATGSTIEQRQLREELSLYPEEISLVMGAMSDYYYYRQLTSKEKIIYAEISLILKKKTPIEVEISADTSDDIEKVYQAFINDHPDIFYVNGFTFSKHVFGGTSYITFCGKYTYEENIILKKSVELDQVTKPLIYELERIPSDYEKIKRIYEEIILGTDYVVDSIDNQNICSVFLEHKSVCNGYAKAMQYLCDACGLPCILVNGMTGSINHTWCVVMLDGAYYICDPTWGEPAYLGIKDRPLQIDYSYLGITTTDVARTHTPDPLFVIPDCTATTDNYFYQEGNFIEEYSREQMKEIFAGEDEKCFMLRAKDEKTYEECKQNLIANSEIFKYIPDPDLKYSLNDQMYILCFW